MSLCLDILDSVLSSSCGVDHIGRADDIRECIAVAVGLEWSLSTEGSQEFSTPILEELYLEFVALSECPM
jgi:hypothetical protein